MKRAIILLTLAALSLTTTAQDLGFSVQLVATPIEGLDGLHSYAFGQADGKWLLVGGRLDGLHARQPFNAFPATSNNDELIVVDPTTGSVWSSDLASVSSSIQEQLQATNFCFYQMEDTLYILGGYAYSVSAADHITFPNLSTLVVSDVIDAVINGSSLDGLIQQTEDQRTAVTGGHLTRFNDEFILVGGHRFDGRYNPMGHNTYTQSYTDAIRTFKVSYTGGTPIISVYSETIDAAHLHRRDYNLVPQIFGDGTFGHMISSGVFQVNVDLPFLYPVEIRNAGHQAVTGFNQYLSNYHSAVTTIYDSTTLTNHSIFFGGMARYYYADDELIQDDLVPFVKTISILSRDELDNLTEIALPIEMPELLGASAEFIPNPVLSRIENEITPFHSSIDTSILLGHIFGGILSTEMNPFSANNTQVTSASSNLYEVWLHTEVPTEVNKVSGSHTFQATLYPNPSDGDISARIECFEPGSMDVLVIDQSGRIVKNISGVEVEQGTSDHVILSSDDLARGSYFVTMILNNIYVTESPLLVR